MRTIIMTDPIKVSNTIDGQKTLQFFEESIISHIRDMYIFPFVGKGNFYFLSYDKNNNLIGIAWVESAYTNENGVYFPAFIREFGNVNYTKTCKYSKKGYGEKLLDQIINKVGREFRLSCLDDNAEHFWMHMAEKKGFEVTELGTTLWGTKALHFRDFGAQ